MESKRKITILGSGPAGYTAAIYAARAGLEPLLIHGSMSGGQLMLTTEVENFPGFADGIMGPDLMDAMRLQAKRFGTDFLEDHAESVDLTKRPFEIKTVSGLILTDSLIIATGARARQLGLESEKKLIGRGVSFCATCDGFFFKDKIVYVIGGGDSAMEEAIGLARFAREVTVVSRTKALKASRIMADRARKEPKISILSNSIVKDILGADKGEVTGLSIENLESGEVKTVDADGVFVAIGHQPNTELLSGQLRLTGDGYIETDGVKTSVAGVFAAGDVMDSRYRQAIVAAGSGSAAALEAQWYLEGQHSEPAFLSNRTDSFQTLHIQIQQGIVFVFYERGAGTLP